NQTEEAEPTPSSIISERFSDIDYGGKELRILGIEAGKQFYVYVGPDFQEIWAEGYTGEITNDAIFDRNSRAEELLNIHVVPVWEGSSDALNKRFAQSVTAGSDDFDIALSGLSAAGTPLQAGYLANLCMFENLDVTSPWWDENFTDTFTLFGDRLYFLSGDYQLNDDYAVCPIYFNKAIVTNAGLDLPYDLVREGKWTMDEMYNLEKACEQDLNGDGVLDMKNDIVAHIENQDKVKHFVYAFNEKSIEIDENGEFFINTLGERHINVVERIFTYGYEKQMIYTNQAGTTYDEAFITGHATSYLMNLGSINLFRDMADDFGIVPGPKYDEEQETYGNYISNYVVTSLICPITVTDRSFIGTCIETLGAFSSETVDTALYDTLLASKLVRDNESVEMLHICMDTKVYDWAVDFSWGSTYAAAYNGVYDSGTFNYVSAATKILKVQQKTMEKLLNQIREFQE
ncbi:MAG: hypothetical protein IKX19_07580, partial [Clostridia bacterium]|nr:hypothetical protein [Clostridia bacterium]